MLIIRLLVFAIGLTVGLLILKYLDRIVYNLGKSDWAEAKFGAGGTYVVWQWAALAIIVITFLAAFII